MMNNYIPKPPYYENEDGMMLPVPCRFCKEESCLAHDFQEEIMETDVWENIRERLMIHEREGYDINRLMRKNLYRMFVRYGYMQIMVETRTELPTCVTNVICKKYPSEVYVGFQAHPNDKEGKSQVAL